MFTLFQKHSSVIIQVENSGWYSGGWKEKKLGQKYAARISCCSLHTLRRKSEYIWER